MNKSIIKQARGEYLELIQVSEEINSIREYMCEKGYSKEKIKRCLQEIKKEIISEEKMIRESFYNASDYYSECNIYIFIGAYRRRNEQHDSLVQNYKRADYFLYQNLESRLSLVIVSPSEQKQFEKDNIILKFDDGINIRKKIEKLQYIYFKEYLNNPGVSENDVLKKLRQYL